ncbi:hypothetical protein [Chitinophaga qingshengii]|uniref:Uncharacterized protein n=1 Tax=Chitinophaga qingshengii TaxID=1569794 RepID=A0ABR7TSJ5_9BACT|nr:hypothetical protein [Chitinophaga qingshengii]MBC9933451.1 hypothetical protein [Chitinophaga qingshengii]
MRRLATVLILVPAMAFFSCNNSSSTGEVPLADSVKTVSFDFKEWLKHLKPVEPPVNTYDLENIDSTLGPFAQSGFHSVSAGIVSRHKNYVAIAAQCIFKKDNYDNTVLLLVYSPDGKEIARQEIGSDKDETKNNETNSMHKWPEFLNDTTFWVKETWYTQKKGDDVGDSKARMKQFRIDYTGKITAVPQETVTFDAYASRFKPLTIPFTITYPNVAGLKPVSLQTPFLDFSEWIYFEKVDPYHYGKIDLPGKGTYLLYATGQLNGGESVMDSTVQLVYHSPDGKESSSIRLNGYSGSEGYYTASKNASIAADGTIRVIEESNDNGGTGEELYFGNTMEDEVTYTPKEGGKLKRQLVKKNFITEELSVNDLKELLANRRSNYAANTEPKTEIDQSLYSIQRNDIVLVRMHVYDNGAEQLVELYTIKPDLKVLDRYVLLNTLKSMPYDKVKAADDVALEGEHYKADNLQILNGPAIVTLKDKVLQITPEGKFQVQ